MNKLSQSILLCLLALITLAATCKKVAQAPVEAQIISLDNDFSSAPSLSPLQSMNTMELEQGFEISLVAAEPLLNTPVALEFDEEGRIWVVEMEAYMKDTLGSGEDRPSGKIVLLSDRNGDGQMDERRVIIDSLVLPRAISLIENGILVAEPPRLWFYELENDRVKSKTLVDESYAEGGNVEHQPNGLLRALDNWIYSAKSSKRYRKTGDKWLIERTHFRGQWGISQDENGRLFYNNNSENILGDLFSPGLGMGNKNQQQISGFNSSIVADNRVYPIRPTTGVNRAYMDGVLDDSLRLLNFTAASSPLFYTGSLFGEKFRNNAFVAEPAANLIKRNILNKDGFKIQGRQAYQNREFLRSHDERFRPVSLANGPDGSLYVVDMYRGIIQHKTYLTPHLRDEIRKRDLSNPTSFGRIYKIHPTDHPGTFTGFNKTPENLVQLLESPNGWIRNKAQQLIIDGNYRELIVPLKKLVQSSANNHTRIHALWALEGLNLLSKDEVLPLLLGTNWELKVQALTAVPSVINKANYPEFLSAFKQILDQGEKGTAIYIAYLIPQIRKFDESAAENMLWKLATESADDIYLADAVITNLENRESSFLSRYQSAFPNSDLILSKQLNRVLQDIQKADTRPGNKKEYPKGASLYKTVCQPCHGPSGGGVRALGPPLNNSEWVTGEKTRLAAIILHGLTGPVTVDGKLYTVPEISGEMPGIASNSSFTDADIAEVMNYIRTSWSNRAEPVNAKDVTETRTKHKGRVKPFEADDF